LGQQEEGNAEKRHGDAQPRCRDHNRQRSDLDQSRQSLAPRHLAKEIRREPFVHHATARHAVVPLGHPYAGDQRQAGHEGQRSSRLKPRAEVKALGADRIGNDDNGQKEQKIDRAEPVIASCIDAT
jgi:hypothetical protein